MAGRNALYAKLFKEPLYKAVSDDKRVAVRIRGTGDAALEAVKAVFWVGQMSRDYSLSIACEGGEFRERVMQAMPGLDERYAAFLWGDTVRECGYVIDTDTLPEDADADEELLRYARNINFAYDMDQNQRTKKTPPAVFAGYRDDPDASYSYWSSMASALHMPYKLRVCRDQSGCREGQELPVLREAIRERNELYNILLEIEHRRWCAYMISEGWQKPTEDELLAYAFRGGCDHRQKRDKLHPCLCDGCVSGCHLREHFALFDEAANNELCTVSQVRAYCEDTGQAAGLTELDYTSLALHAIAAKRCRETITEQTVEEAFSFLHAMEDPTQKKLGQALCRSVYGMLRGAVNSVAVFESGLRLARTDAELGKKDGVCDAIKRQFDILRRRNRKPDMAAIDEALIDMIPFVLWYGKDYSTVITFSDGNASDDVIVPTMIVPETAIFIGENADSPAYSRVVKDYFSSRGGNVNVVTVNCDPAGLTLDEAVRLLTDLTGRYPNAVLNSLHSNSPVISIAMGYAASQKQFPIVTYDHAHGITDVHSGEMLSAGLTNKGLTVSEFIRLMRGTENNADRYISDMAEYDRLSELFRDQLRTYTGGQSQMAKLARFLQKKARLSAEHLGVDEYMSPKSCEISFAREDFRSRGIEDALRMLSDYRIIHALRIETDTDVTARFECRDKALFTCLNSFAKNSAEGAEYRFLQSNVMGKELKVASTRIRNADDSAEHRPLLEALKRAGFVEELSFSGPNNECLSCTFRSVQALELFKWEGTVFELAVFNKMRNTGLFDDVQTGVKLSWDVSAVSDEDELKTLCTQSTQWGYPWFKSCRDRILDQKEKEPEKFRVNNEIDVVAMLGMQPVFVSCKDVADPNREGNKYLEQLYSLCSYFRAKGILAVTRDRGELSRHLLARARKLGIAVLDREILLAPAEDFFNEIKVILTA